MFVVLQWYYNERYDRPIFPELSNVFGPFADQETADAWTVKASTWGGWGRYEYKVEKLHPPEETK